MHASTWHGKLCSRAKAATCSTGSTTPWGYCGAEAISTIVLRLTARRASPTSIRIEESIDTNTGVTSKYLQAGCQKEKARRKKENEGKNK